jgi:hypothetical protein
MMTALRISNVGRPRVKPLPTLRVSDYERVASWLLALLLVGGAVAFCLLVIWLGMHAGFAFSKSVPVHIAQPDGGGQGEVGDQPSLEAPSIEEMAAESDLDDPRLESTLDSLIDATARPELAVAFTASFDHGLNGSGGDEGKISGPGPGEGRPGIPPHLRWEIDWGGVDTLETYARKLDFFGIELGTYGVPGPGKVTYIKNLSHTKPDLRVGVAKLEKRLYMSWRSGALKDADRQLAAKAGVPPGKILFQFFDKETEQLLLRTEQEFDGRDASTIHKTRFGLRPIGKGYEFFVIAQR